MSEWLCQICWIQTKTFHNFYKRIKNRHENYLKPTKTAACTEIKQERNISPVEAEHTLEADLHHFVKWEKIEPPEPLPDKSIYKEVNSDFEESNEVGKSEVSDNKHIPSSTKTVTNDDSPGKSELKDYSLLSQSGREVQDTQIREFFNMNCELCSDVEFATLLKAKQHYRKVHDTQGYIKCCGRKFIKRQHIVQHICNHTNPNAHRCHQCSKSFQDERSLKSHIDNHVPLDSREYKCRLCRSSFAKASTLKNHVQRKHTSKTGEKFSCDNCGKK